MARVLQVSGTKVKIITDDGKVVSVPMASVNYLNPTVGDRIDVHQSGDKYVITKATGTTKSTETTNLVNTTVTEAANVIEVANTKHMTATSVVDATRIEELANMENLTEADVIDAASSTGTTDMMSNLMYSAPDGSKSINKHLFVWIGTFVLGNLGFDRFMRGQIGMGLCKLFFSWVTFGLWVLIDWLIAMSKAYGSAYKDVENITFDKNGNYIK